MKKIKKAVIPAAGLGTRFLPATKTVPKEMLTIVDAPIILYVVEEAVQAGIEDIVLIAGRGKHAIEDFFDTSYELEDRLARDGKTHLLERLNRIRDMANVISIRQKQALGLGHAVYSAAPIVGQEPFAVLLGDEITMGSKNEPNVTALLTQSFSETGVSAISVMEVAEKDVSKYGIANCEKTEVPHRFKVTSLVEKPKASETSSRWALPGRYVFDNSILNLLKDAKPSLNGEIQLTDTMNLLVKNKGLHAHSFTAKRFDAGDKIGYLQANIELGLTHPDLHEDLKKYLIQLGDQLKKGTLQ